VHVIEVARPNRQIRRRHGKTDLIDAVAAARSTQSGEATRKPKSHDGPVEALRTLKALQLSANKARTQALNQIHNLLVTAPEDVRARLTPLPRRELLATCAAFRIRADDDTLSAVIRAGTSGAGPAGVAPGPAAEGPLVRRQGLLPSTLVAARCRVGED
jgi:hypothetical protein